MTTTLTAKGQVTIPRDIRTKQGLMHGQRFLVLYSSTGEILLRPVKRSGKSWMKALREMRGLKLNRVDGTIRDVAW